MTCPNSTEVIASSVSLGWVFCCWPFLSPISVTGYSLGAENAPGENRPTPEVLVLHSAANPITAQFPIWPAPVTKVTKSSLVFGYLFDKSVSGFNIPAPQCAESSCTQGRSETSPGRGDVPSHTRLKVSTLIKE